MPRKIRLCEIDGCDRKHYVRGLCVGHHTRRRTGRPLGGPIKEYAKDRGCSVDGCDDPDHHAQGFCKLHYHRHWRASKSDMQERDRRYYLKVHFNITPEEYDELLAGQGGVCAICSNPPNKGRWLDVDHDHSCCTSSRRTCGRCIRGLLCNACNTHLGILEKVEWRAAADEYLAKYAS